MEKMSEKLIEEEVNDIITIEDLKKYVHQYQLEKCARYVYIQNLRYTFIKVFLQITIIF